MQQDRGSERFVTPEAVEVELDLAGLGSRMIAVLVDGAIQVAAFLLVALVLGQTGIEGVSAAAAVLASVFLLFLGYFIVFEGMWGGRTPGKRAQRIRVVRVDGRPVGWVQAVVRNLLRLVDVLPTLYAIGAVSIVVSRRSQRLGDLAAGTVVVRERPSPSPHPLLLPSASASAARGLDATGVGEREYSLIRSFLERRSGLDPDARRQLSGQLAGMIRPQVGGAAAWTGSEEALLEAVAVAYRARFEPVSPREHLPPPPA